MLYAKKGYPEENELVACTVTSVQYNSVFAKIEEYGKTGLIHISEISPGRIRNIRDYVKEGKLIICKVIGTDEKKGHIDLSLRRVTEIQKKQKTNERKQEQRAEKIIEDLANEAKKDVKKVYDEVSKQVFEEYDYLFQAFEDAVDNNYDLKKLPYGDKLDILVREKIKPKTVSIHGELAITSYEPDGVNIIKDVLTKSELEIKYLGSGKYSVKVTAKEYKEAEKKLKEGLDNLKDSFGKKAAVDFKRRE